jgi:predicted component of type VI protein secretion system
VKWALIVDRGKRKGMIISIEKSPFIIGRNSDCQLRAASSYISDRHCELLTEDGKFVVRDCNSTNGTFINSQRIQGQVELHEGDRLEVGMLAFVVCQGNLKLMKEKPSEPESRKPSQLVEDDSLENILLKLDENDAEQPDSGPGNWRNIWAEEESSQPAPVRIQKAENYEPGNKPSNSASDVANMLLNGQGAILKRRSRLA